ncbi:SOS response-associated peptidase family protein [Pseudomonas resinovorans]|nr:SOS response-associated peptidase family protein [Pseudomonas resinovorans]MDE3735535.1 SOS response-associated peptidase family protein [Pseudomonas resinovorans]
MCGRYVSSEDWAIEHFWHIGARNSGRWIQSFNVAPTTTVPMVRLNEHGEPEIVAARWGLIPPWWKQPKLPTLTFNARSEEAVASEPSRLALFNARRRLV